MKRRHIAFFIFPHPPQLGPTLPLASVLVRRGHRVSYVTSGRFEARVCQLGAQFVRTPEISQKEILDSDVKDPLEGPICRYTARTLAQVSPLYEQDPPDLIIYDLITFTGRILAHKLNVPAIQTSPTFAHCRQNWERQVPDPELRRNALGASSCADRLLQHHGIVSSDFLFHREKLNIYLFPKVLQPDGNVFDESCFYAGRCAAEQPYYGNWQRSDSGNRPVVLISNSTTYEQGKDFFRTCIEALSGLNCYILLSIGDSGNPAELQPLPDHVEIVQHNSHVKLLPYVDAFVCTGGIITASEATYHGVPLVVTSLGIIENEWEGDRFERLGIAIHLKKDAGTNMNALRSAVDHALSDPGMRSRVNEVRRIVQREPGAEETVNRIETYLDGCPTRSV